jgi:hypothetical protein
VTSHTELYWTRINDKTVLSNYDLGLFGCEFQTVFYRVTDMWSLEYRSFSTINSDLFDFSVDSPQEVIKGWYSA